MFLFLLETPYLCFTQSRSTNIQMACFVCNQFGHWASTCPDRKHTCNFCGEEGHWASRCPVQKKAKATSVQQEPTCLADVLFNNHLAPRPDMKATVDKFVTTYFKRRGMIDEYALVDHVFNQTMVCTTDAGHIAVVLYIIAKFCDITPHDEVKNFLAELHTSSTSFEDFRNMLRKYGITPVQGQAGKIHYRKLAGGMA